MIKNPLQLHNRPYCYERARERKKECKQRLHKNEEIPFYFIQTE
jgi:hypothetical protein